MIIFWLCILRGHDSGNGGSSGNIGSPQGGIANSNYESSADKASRNQKKVNDITVPSSDPIVPETVKSLENGLNEKITDINVTHFRPDGSKECEIDIETSKVIVEVKSGTAKHIMNQVKRGSQYAQGVGKKYIIFCPNGKPGVITNLRKNGYTVATTYSELLNLAKIDKGE
jgi:hypothetical protein